MSDDLREDELDRLLHAAEPGADPAAVSRLRDVWRQERARDGGRERGNRLRWMTGLAAAAVLAVGFAGVVWWAGVRETGSEVVAARGKAAEVGSVVARVEKGGGGVDAAKPLKGVGVVVAVREPTLGERLVGIQMAEQVSAKATGGEQRGRGKRAGVVASEALAEARAAEARVAALMERMGGPLVADRLAAAQELGREADGKTLLTLGNMAREGQLRREAVVALLASPDPSAQRMLDDQALLSLLWSLQLQAASDSATSGRTGSATRDAS